MAKSKQQIDIDALKQAASSRWVEILNHVGNLPIESLDGKHHPCSKCGGTDRFRLIDKSAGAVLCNVCFSAKNGDGIAAIQWAVDIDFKEATKRIAEHLGIDAATYKTNGKAAKAKAARKKKKGPDQDIDPGKDLEWQPWSTALVAFWLAKKPGISEAALLAAGARLAKYKSLTVICFPIVGESLSISEPVGWTLMNCLAEMIPKRDKTGKVVGEMKIKSTRGSKAGLIGQHAIERLKSDEPDSKNRDSDELVDKSIKVTWKVEGVSDMLALLSAIPEDKRDTHLVVSNSNGTGEKPKKWQAELLAKCPAVAVIHDCDKPGRDGAAVWAWAISAHQDDGLETRDVQLPYEIAATQGKDIRDWLSEGHSYEDFLSLAKAADPVEAEAADYEDELPEVALPGGDITVTQSAWRLGGLLSQQKNTMSAAAVS